MNQEFLLAVKRLEKGGEYISQEEKIQIYLNCQRKMEVYQVKGDEEYKIRYYCDEIRNYLARRTVNLNSYCMMHANAE